MHAHISTLRGIVPPLVTPLVDPDTLDGDGVDRLVDHVVGTGVAGLFVLGTTGEGPNLSYQIRHAMIERTVAAVRGRVPVLVGITDSSFSESVSLARSAAAYGAAAVVAAPPYYHKPTPTELMAWVRALHDRSPLPIFLYNMPAHTRTWFDFETLKAAMQLDEVIGFKDSGGDLAYFDAVLKLKNEHRPEWRTFVGPEHLTAAATGLGGDGGVNGGANLFPRLFVKLFQAADRHDADEVDRLQKYVATLGAIYAQGDGESSVVRGLKCALACAGLCSEATAIPWSPLGPPERVRIQRVVEDIKSEWDCS
ncbi:MAG TPA: dihydrodipicolinate synthase family protein [Fimbriiglobus sp.]|jgi:4-hydroxy-tetrahydrodipicolinate synthase